MRRRFWLAVARFAMRRAGVTLMSAGYQVDPTITSSTGSGATVTWRYISQ